MRIVFFGSSHGVPEPNRRCSSTLIECGESRYFIDMGTQSMEQLITRRIPIESVKSIFITHMHGDHTDGLISFIDLCNWKFKNVHPKFYLPTDTDKAKCAIESWILCNNGSSLRDFDFRKVEEGLLYDDGTLRITAFRTLHIDESYAYLVEAEGKRVFFSGDMCHKGPAHDFPVSIFEKQVDLAICESAHFDATDFLPIFKGRENLKKVCFNHYSDKHIISVVQMQQLLNEIPVLIATDGMEITV